MPVHSGTFILARSTIDQVTSNPFHSVHRNAFAGYLYGLHSFYPANMNWTLHFTTSGAHHPSARDGHGFTSAGGKLYVHGGVGYSGNTSD
jgi:hypothetical protein